MKLFILLMLSFFIFPCVIAQNSDGIDPRLSVRFSEETLQNWEENDPNQLELFTFELNNSYDILILPHEKTQSLPPLHYVDYQTASKGEKVKSINEDDFNLFLYAYNRKRKGDNLYRIANTNQVLVIYSNKKFVNLFNESRGYEK